MTPPDEQRLLRESEEKYRALVETTGTGYVIIDSEGRVLDANREYIRLSGHEALEEICGRRVTEWTAPHDLARNAEEVGKCMERGFVNNLEIDYVNKEGKFTPVEMNATVLPMAEGTRIVTLCRDISERKRVETALKESEEQFRLLVQNQGEGIGMADLEERFTFANPAAEAIFGVPPGKLIGRRMEDFMTPEQYAGVLEQTWKRNFGERSSYELEIVRADGEPRSLLVTACPRNDPQGRFIGSFGIFRDITEHKRAEEALQESEQRFKAIFDHSNDGILVADMETKRFLTGNETICQMLGYSPDEIKDLGVMDIHPPKDIPYVIDQFEKQARKEIAVAKDLPVKRKDGGIFYADVSSFPIALSGKSYLVGAFRDTTERRSMEAQLIQAQKMEAVGLLAGGIAHEFNNILGGILGYASLMRLKMEPDHPFWGYVETIEKSSQRAALLTSQLLGFARKGKYDLRLLSLNLLAEDTLAIVRQTFDRAVTVEVRLAEGLPNVEGDTMQLQQVLMNLCINARDAMPKGGSLVLTTGTEQVAEGDERIPLDSKPGWYVLLSVADTGCGMDEETQAKIFEPFFTTKEKGKGTGLGLAMVYGVVKNHGGFVTVRSEVGRGSAFTLHLPAAEKPAERRPEALAAPERSRGAVPDQTILVVDDEENIRFLARDILEGEGYRVLLAEDGARALEVYREHQGEIGLVVLDLIMPKLGGGEVFLKMKEMDPGVQVLVSSGYSQEGKAQEILSGGALGFVQKPFHVRDLISQVRQGLDGKEG